MRVRLLHSLICEKEFSIGIHNERDFCFYECSYLKEEFFFHFYLLMLFESVTREDLRRPRMHPTRPVRDEIPNRSKLIYVRIALFARDEIDP